MQPYKMDLFKAPCNLKTHGGGANCRGFEAERGGKWCLGKEVRQQLQQSCFFNVFFFLRGDGEAVSVCFCSVKLMHVEPF